MEPCATDERVEVGAMLYTLVDPTKGAEVAYNRWYERDHFYGGCMIGPWFLAGGRWVATRRLKDLRFPNDSTVAEPVDAGSFLSLYWIHRGHEVENFTWSSAQVHHLYENGRGFEERHHAHTAIYMARRDWARDTDPVPLLLALDHRYRGLVSIHVDRREDVKFAEYDEWFDQVAASTVLAPDSPVALVSSWSPVIPKEADGAPPMKLGSGPGTRARSAQLWFCEDDPESFWDLVRDHAAAVEESGLATVRLAAGFIPTVPGTDTYCDQLW
jgi:hypothetical protein